MCKWSGESYVVDPTCLASSISCVPSTHAGMVGSAASYTSTCTVQANGDYAGTVNLSCPSSGGVSCTVNGGYSVALDQGGQDTRTLTYNVPSSAAAGDYTLTVTAEDSSDSSKFATAEVLVKVTPPPTEYYRGVPACLTVGPSCSFGEQPYDGRGVVGPEPNYPNTLDGCADGGSGSYHSDESCDAVELRTISGNNFAPGEEVEIKATVYAWSSGSADRADFYYTEDATATPVVWQEAAINVPAGGGGARTLTATYTLGAGGNALQAVRVNFRYNGQAQECSSGSYDDTDDLVFTVDVGGGGGGTPPTTPPYVSRSSRSPASLDFCFVAELTDFPTLAAPLALTFLAAHPQPDARADHGSRHPRAHLGPYACT